MDKRKELQEQGYGAVVTGDRVAHATAGTCWTDADHLIPLSTLVEARAHGYEACTVCAGGSADDGAGAGSDETEA